MRRNIKNAISDMTNMPKDVILGVPIIRLVGQEELYIENYRGIMEYTECMIRIQTKIGQVLIWGRKLEIVYYTNDEMKITGSIESFEYKQGGSPC